MSFSRRYSYQERHRQRIKRAAPEFLLAIYSLAIDRSPRGRVALLLTAFLVVALVAGGAIAYAAPANSTPEKLGRKFVLSDVGTVDGMAVAKQILIHVKPGVSPKMLEKLNAKAGAKSASSIRKLGIVRVTLGDTDIDEAVRIYKSSGLVEFAEPNYVRRATAFAPNDPLYSQQWGLTKIGMGQAWETAGTTLNPVNVAVLDTGVDATHEDLKGALAMSSVDSSKILGRHFYTDSYGRQLSDDSIQDNAGHGTHISGIIAGRTNNGLGIAGIASAARIMPVKVLDDVGFGDDASIAEGMIWAADNGARVINMSLAGPTPSSTLANAVKYVRNKGMVIVAAIGNEGTSSPSYPAAYEGVIGVGAVDSQDAWVPQSNSGPNVDVVAPGMSILSTFPPAKSSNGQPYEVRSGTSMATGFVSGLASMILSINPALSANRVEGILYVTADDLGATGWDRYYGHGRINASRAVYVGSDNNPPAVTISSPTDGVMVNGPTLAVSASTYDTEGSIALVEFYVNGERVGTDVAPPYECSINASNLHGKSTIRTVAYDNSGNSSSAEVTCYKQTFTDVGISYWAFQDVETLAAFGVITGYPGGMFEPDGLVNRAEFVKMIAESMGLPKKLNYSGYFKDVPNTHWAWPYIEAAYDMGIITGYRDGEFLPENQIKRVEVTNILLKSGIFPINILGSEFTDVPMSYWGYKPIMSARNAGIVSGYPDNCFRPERALSRAEAARIIKNSLY